MKFTLELDMSGEEFTRGGGSNLVDGGTLGFYLTRLAKRVDGHAMAAGENGKVVTDDEGVIGSWKIEG